MLIQKFNTELILTNTADYQMSPNLMNICHQHFMLHRAINYFIERFGYFSVCSVMLNAVKHQKVTKTLNHVINSSMQHKLLMAYMSEYTHNNVYSFINCHQTIRMIISKPFHDSQCC